MLLIRIPQLSCQEVASDLGKSVVLSCYSDCLHFELLARNILALSVKKATIKTVLGLFVVLILQMNFLSFQQYTKYICLVSRRITPWVLSIIPQFLTKSYGKLVLSKHL